MTSLVTRRFSFLVGGLIALAFLGHGIAAYASEPYLKVYGGDVWAGGWFALDNNCDTTVSSSNNYQDPLYNPGSGDADYPADADRYGGIDTFANTNGSGDAEGGSSSQYAAYSLGAVYGTANTSGSGFYSDGALASSGNSPVNALTFASGVNNNPATAWGGVFQYTLGGSTEQRQEQCIPDYYSSKPSVTQSFNSTTTGLPSQPTSGIYSATSSAGSPAIITEDGSAITITQDDASNGSPVDGRKVIVYVDGPAYIGSNITFNLDKADDIPQFALVANGPIYISPSVTRLDGVFVAELQDTPTSDTPASPDGVIWTCHPDNDDPITTIYLAGTCNHQLVVNGSLIAKQINFLRTNGDVASATTGDDTSSCDNSAYGNGTPCSNIAEIINYTPENLISGPIFGSGGGSSSGNTLDIQSLISLPPVF